ncbi:hypothetical protein POVWA1_064770 [Plasmodium ovale wallikeri]|uniref:Uncharacterized protein n=1 Tax=Plasmodium ovale wallikeri TaxID=864142 RepID=A0A1A9ABV5_PLAOA|nr:hypothetical protein POVWA1_064770 [Plasmodium ovale wallikeri]
MYSQKVRAMLACARFSNTLSENFSLCYRIVCEYMYAGNPKAHPSDRLHPPFLLGVHGPLSVILRTARGIVGILLLEVVL